MKEEFRTIPGYENYVVNEFGEICTLAGDVLSITLVDGYWYVFVDQPDKPRSLKRSRAVALAWVENPNPEVFQLVNHLDGVKTNDHFSNLEWTDYSGNNYHAVNSGLRSDNRFCKVRDVFTKQVTEFASLAQAAEFVGMPKDTPVCMLMPVDFGSLVKRRFEVKYAEDESPWFYEDLDEPIQPARYEVTIVHPCGRVNKVYRNSNLLKEYQLYDASSKSIAGLVEHGNLKYPELKFSYRDSWKQPDQRKKGLSRATYRQRIKAFKGGKALEFDSLTKCAEHFDVDRSVIQLRLCVSRMELDGWRFSRSELLPAQLETAE